ncbi:MAG TPA: methyltransferase [Candidatus Binatia bacterium]|jgi:SAM-dependent methyltransferase
MDFSALARLAGGYAEARTIQAAVELGVFEALQHTRDASQLSAYLSCDPRAMELLLDALVSTGLLKKSDSMYSLNDTSSIYLVKSSPKYLGGMIAFDASLWNAWGQLAHSIRSGKPARRPDMYQNAPEDTERFIGAMDSLVRARGDAEIVLKRLDLGEVKSMLDVGSGPATYPIEFCGKHPQLRAAIFDLPETLKVTEKFVRDAGMRDRIDLIPGNYRCDNIPGKYDLVFLSNIIHGESDEENGRLMAKLYGCIEPGGRIVIKDHILDQSRTQPASGAVFALMMLLTTEHGKCYSYTDVKTWLDNAGCRNIGEIPLPPPLTSSLVIGTK